MILTIEYNTPVAVLKKVQQHIAKVRQHSPNMNGVNLQIQRGDYTSLSGEIEGYAAVALFHDIQRIIELG
jgi:hypothetical protein